MSIESVMPSNNFIFCHPLLLLPSIFPSIRISSKELALHIRWPKYWNFSFSISPSNEYSGLISFSIDWLDLLADQGTLKHHGLNAFFDSQPFSLFSSHIHTRLLEKPDLCQQSDVSAFQHSVFLTFVIAFLPRSSCLLIS